MKRYKTYGKSKTREDMLTTKWDNIMNSTEDHSESEDDDIKLHDDRKLSVDPLNEVFSQLAINSSTPKCPSDCSFKCRRSVSLVSNSNKKRRKRLSILQSDIHSEDCSYCSSNNSLLKEIFNSSHKPDVDVTEKLLELCDENKIIDLEDYVTRFSDLFVKKLGEGSYGEVFEKNDCNENSFAVKVVPVGRDTLVNGWEQMKLEEIISEMAVSRKLSDLTDTKENSFYTEGFVQLNRLLFCKGIYPSVLVELWETWDKENNSENDHPEIFNEDQTYVLFETTNGGMDLEKYKVKTVKEAVSILKQLVISIGAAEILYKFEHRDLHHGNILIQKTSRKFINMRIKDNEYNIESSSIKVSIIDFTMSRLQTEGGVIFSDISTEESFFTGEGDIQFQVYRDMREHNTNNWEDFNPYTNVLWVKYVAEKIANKLRKNATILKFINRVLQYSSCFDILERDVLFT